MTITNVYGTSSQYFTIGDITIYTGVSPFAYPDLPTLGKDGDMFLANDGTRYSKKNGEWQILITEFTGNTLPDNSLGDNGDLYRLVSSNGITGIKYIKLNDSTVEPAGIKWLPATKELYSDKPNNELFNNLDVYTISKQKYVKINGEWVESTSEFSGTELPPARLGADGDLYLNTTNNKYYYKANGNWEGVDATYNASIEPPFENYGQNEDIWINPDFTTVYVRENNQWVNKSNDNRVFGANSQISTDYYSDRTIFESIRRRFYAKINGQWVATGMFYRQPQNPENYTGTDNDIVYNYNTDSYFIKVSSNWQSVNLTGISSTIPTNADGNDNDLVYIEEKTYLIIANNSVSLADYNTSSTVPLTENGEENDIYNITPSNTTYIKKTDSWVAASAINNADTNPENIAAGVLDNYLYNMTNKSFVNELGVWKNILNTITDNTQPNNFTADANSIYKTTDKYYVYVSSWIETTYADSTTEPQDSSGVNYDIYSMPNINKKFAKMNNVWVDISSNAELTGTTEPSTAIGDIGDIYTNTTDNSKYIKIEIAQWETVANEYDSTSTTPPDSFWNLNSIFKNYINEYYVKTSNGWEVSPLYYETSSLPPVEYWNNYDLFILNTSKYVKFNNTWNLVVGELNSSEEPNSNMWTINSVYDTGTAKYIKTENNIWVEVNNEFDSDDEPANSFWQNNSIYQTTTNLYMKINNMWEPASNIVNNNLQPNINDGLNGDVFITSNYQFFLKTNNIWRNITNIFTNNTQPRYNSFGVKLGMYELENGSKFVKYNDVWNYIQNTVEGDEMPYNDTGTIGSLFTLLPVNTVYVLDNDYAWREIGNQYTPTSDPLNSQGEYLWLYIKSEADMLYHNGTSWVRVSGVTKSQSEPTPAEGAVNNVWILLSSGLYLKDNNAWGKISTSTNTKYDIRQEIYLFS